MTTPMPDCLIVDNFQQRQLPENSGMPSTRKGGFS